MPLYEYRCLDCKKRSTVLVLSLANQARRRQPAPIARALGLNESCLDLPRRNPKRLDLKPWRIPAIWPGSMKTIHRAWLDS